jgi:hypothetical protein
MSGTFTTRHALWHILGEDLAESIIADMGAPWAKVSAAAELAAKKASGKSLDHIDKWFLDLLDYEAGKLSEAGWRAAKQQFKRRHRRHVKWLLREEIR